ncbi:MAG: peptidase domain-containing ABC transporter [Sediminibacterium sp.]
MKKLRHIHKSFIRQQDESDCGVACILSLLKFYGGNSTFEKLRELSGTTKQGTTLLGLYQCAGQIGFEAEGFEADIENLKKLNIPCILHIQRDNLQHYIIFYGILQTSISSVKFLVGDPAKGVLELDEIELNEIWQSKILLTLKPAANFIKNKTTLGNKRNWFLTLLKEDYPVLGISIFLGIIIAVLGLSTAVFSQKLIDEILPKANTEKLILGLVLLLVLLMIKTMLTYLRQHFLLIQSRDFNIRITGSFYEKLLHLPKSFFDHRKTGDMIARMSDTMRIQKSIAYLSGSFFIDLLIVFASAIFLFLYSWPIACLTLLSVPLMILTASNFHKAVLCGQREVMGAYAKNESNYVDTIQGIDVIKAGNKEPFFIGLTKGIYTFFQSKNFSLEKIANSFNLFTEGIASALIITIIATASYLVLKKQMTIGEMVAILSISGGLIPSAARLALTNLQIQEAKVAFDRMYEFVSVKPEYNPADSGSDKAPFHFKTLEIKNISFRFPGRKSLLENISMEVNKGEIVALLGECGCGKSTALQIIQKFYASENGGILVNGKNLNQINTPLWRNVIANVPQEIKIFNGSLLYNITLNNKLTMLEEVHQFCVKYGFEKYFLELPQAYLTIIGEDGIKLSGGQKQLLALARALFKKPQLLLLDEATASMDKNTEQFILGKLEELKNDMAIILVTHKAHTAKIADRVYTIENGVCKTPLHTDFPSIPI